MHPPPPALRWGDVYSERRHPGVWCILDLFTGYRTGTGLIMPKLPIFKLSVKGLGAGGAGQLAENDLESFRLGSHGFEA